MKVYTLTGKSGTGKSYQSMNLCREKHIESMIDDGLFIYRNRVEAGISAKRQKTMVGAIKTALFTQDEHAAAVAKRIKEIQPRNLLIIGTSDKMTDKIVARLGLPAVSKRIYIEDITTAEERDIADRQRHVLGKHVIPAPTLQLKRDFAGYFLDPLKILRGINSRGKAQYAEKTVVRPTFSYMGEFFISDLVMRDIAKCGAGEVPGIGTVLKVYENTSPDNLIVEVAVSIRGDSALWETAMEFQSRLTEVLEYMTAFNVVEVNVEVRGFE